MALIIAKGAPGQTIDEFDGVTDGADQIVATSGNDHIEAGGGQDIIKGGGGADYIDGGAGRDGATYEDSASGVEVNLVTGKGYSGDALGDTLVSIENLYGSKFNDKLIGNSEDNTLDGKDGNDTLKGGGGSDYLVGGAGNDILEIDGADDTVDGGADNDTLILNSNKGLEVNLSSGQISENTNGMGIKYSYYGPSSPYFDGAGFQKPSQPHYNDGHTEVTNVENVFGSAYNDDIYGNDLANVLNGNGGDDVLVGGAGDDTLNGGDGSDKIDAGLGKDLLTGGLGADTFYFWKADESVVVGGKPQDVITDFEQGWDKIDLSHMDFALGDLLVLDNQNVGGTNYSYVGLDSNHNGVFDEGEFAIAVKVAAGTQLHNSDFLI